MTINKIRNFIPQHIADSYPKFVQFLTAYYEWLDQSENPAGYIRHLKDNMDIDKAIDPFLDKIKNDLIPELPETVYADKRLYLKFLNDLKSTKGTVESYKLLFRLLFNESVEIYYPKEDILRTSSGKWVRDELEIYITTFNDIELFNSANISQVHNTGIATGTIREVQILNIPYYSVYKVNITDIEGEFKFGYGINISGSDVTEIMYPVSNTLSIETAGTGYASGDTITVPEGNYYLIHSNISINNRVDLKIKPKNMTVNDIQVFVEGVDIGTDFYIDEGKLVLENYTAGDSVDVYLPSISGIYRVGNVSEAGEILSISTLSFGFGYTDQQTGTILNSGTGAVVNTVNNNVVKVPGYYQDTGGHLSSDKKLQDSDFYQEYSYVIQASRTIDSYADVVKKLLHPAGFKMFGSVSIYDFINQLFVIEDLSRANFQVKLYDQISILGRTTSVDDSFKNFYSAENMASYYFDDFTIDNYLTNTAYNLSHFENPDITEFLFDGIDVDEVTSAATQLNLTTDRFMPASIETYYSLHGIEREYLRLTEGTGTDSTINFPVLLNPQSRWYKYSATYRPEVDMDTDAFALKGTTAFVGFVTVGNNLYAKHIENNGTVKTNTNCGPIGFEHKLEIEYIANKYKFKVDGVLKVTTTTNINTTVDMSVLRDTTGRIFDIGMLDLGTPQNTNVTENGGPIYCFIEVRPGDKITFFYTAKAIAGQQTVLDFASGNRIHHGSYENINFEGFVNSKVNNELVVDNKYNIGDNECVLIETTVTELDTLLSVCGGPSGSNINQGSVSGLKINRYKVDLYDWPMNETGNVFVDRRTKNLTDIFPNGTFETSGGWTLDTDWTINGSLDIAGGTAGDTATFANFFDIGELYYIEVECSVTGGEIEFNDGTTTSTNIQFYHKADGTDFTVKSKDNVSITGSVTSIKAFKTTNLVAFNKTNENVFKEQKDMLYKADEGYGDKLVDTYTLGEDLWVQVDPAQVDVTGQKLGFHYTNNVIEPLTSYEVKFRIENNIGIPVKMVSENSSNVIVDLWESTSAEQFVTVIVQTSDKGLLWFDGVYDAVVSLLTIKKVDSTKLATITSFVDTMWD